MKVKYFLNIIKNVLTFITSFEVLYKVKSRNFLVSIILDKDSALINFIKI